MREWNQIKFRCFPGDTEQMVYDVFPINDRVLIHRTGGGTYKELWVECDEVMQFTGIHDKNGKEIYDGDICKCHVFTQELGENMGVTEGEREFVCSIEFDELGISLKSSPLNSGPIWAYSGFHEESLEVIGNVWENPELLEGKG